MIWPKKKVTQPSEADKLKANEALVEKQLIADRAFWDWAVLYMLNEDDTADAAVQRAVTVADRLLEIRKEKFPVSEK